MLLHYAKPRSRCMREQAGIIGIITPNAYERSKFDVDVEEGKAHGGLYFERGTFAKRDVVIVVSGLATVNSAMATTIMIERYKPKWIMSVGISGSAHEALHFADVAVPSRFMLSDLWVWTRAGWNENSDPLPLEGIDYAKEPPNANFEFPGYAGNPETGTLHVQEQQLMHETADATGQFSRQMFFQSDPRLLDIARRASQLVPLQRCMPETGGGDPACLDSEPKVLVGDDVGVGATGSVFVDNAAWRTFLHDTFNVSVIEMETAALAQVCATYGVPFLGIRSVSDLAGAAEEHNSAHNFIDLAANNAAILAKAVVTAAPCFE